MKRCIIVITLALLASACNSASTNSNAPQGREVAFNCGDGQSLSVRFLAEQGVAILVRNGETIELQQQPSGSGFIYSNNATTIRGKGNDLTVEIGRQTPLQCQAKSP